MSVPNMAFNPPNGLRDVATYPTVPASEADARDQVQDQNDQIRDYINASIVPAVNQNSSDIAALKASYNAIINGNFSVNQRVVSGTVTLAAGQYGHDRWKAGSGGCTYTFATVNNVTTITITAGSLVQVIEGINLVSGTYTLSWTGTAQGRIGGGSYGASGITGNATGGTNLSIEFNAGTLSNVVFNHGDQALPFQPRIFAEEFALCQRYFFKTFQYSDVPVQNLLSYNGCLFYRTPVAGANPTGVRLDYPVRMRIAPTITYYNPAATNNKWRNLSLNADSGGAANQAGGDRGGFIENAQIAGDAASQAMVIHLTAEAEL